MEKLTATTKRLEIIKNQLKTEFIGLDEIIDQFVQAINPWCNMAETQERPLVVNLWGMTGVGKTSLVKRFLELWDKDEDVIHLNMGSKNFIKDTMASMERMYNLEGKKAVLIFDEFQHAKTIDEMGREMDNPVDRMIWQLMDSGKFSFAGMRRYHNDLEEIAVSLEICLEKGVVIEKGKVVEGWELFCDIMDIDFDHFGQNKKEVKFALSKRQFADVYELAMREFPYRSKFKEFLLSLNGQELIEYIKRLDRKSVLSQEIDFSKFLIIIIGNLDEAYKMSGVVSADDDPDIMYEESKKITFSNIKDALSMRFRMEEISRLGNIHIIYPSLSSGVYRSFIKKELENISKRFKENFGCSIQFSGNIEKMLFEEGVVAAQGFRPLRSSIRYIIEANVLELIQQSVFGNTTALMVDMKGDNMQLKAEGKVLSQKTLHLPVREAKKLKHDAEHAAITAVHEAGHGIVYMILRRAVPKVISISTSDHNHGGYMGVNTSYSFFNKELLIREVAIRLAGKQAEELVFGKENVTDGAEQDLKVATKNLLYAYRSGCLSEKNAVYESGSRGSGQLLPEDGECKNWVEEHLSISYKLAAEVLNAQKEAFSALIDLLLKKRILDSEAIETGLAAYGFHCGQLMETYPEPFVYAHKLGEFLTKELELPAVNGIKSHQD